MEKKKLKINDLVQVNNPIVGQLAKLVSGHIFGMGRVVEFHNDPRFVKVRSSSPKCDPETADVWFSKDQVSIVKNI